MRVAIVHEWVASRSGSEKVFEAFAELLPKADLFALTADPSVPIDLGGRPLHLSFLDHRLLRERRELTLPLMPLAWRYLEGDGPYDVVLSSSHAAVKGFRPGRSALHLCYCHTPMRYAWDHDLDQRGSGWVKALPGAALRRWDRRSADWVDDFAANSTVVADRIRRYYRRSARVIHPPVDTSYYAAAPERSRHGALAVSRWIPYKRLDLAIEACAAVGVPLTVAGTGPERFRLQRLAERHRELVRFVASPTDEQLREMYASAEILVFPAFEDFGIIPVEAMAAGTPVVALDRGGTRDSVIDGRTGALVREQTAAAFAEGIARVLETKINAEACRDRAQSFSRTRFAGEIRRWFDDVVGPAAADLEWAGPAGVSTA